MTCACAWPSPWLARSLAKLTLTFSATLLPFVFLPVSVSFLLVPGCRNMADLGFGADAASQVGGASPGAGREMAVAPCEICTAGATCAEHVHQSSTQPRLHYPACSMIPRCLPSPMDGFAGTARTKIFAKSWKRPRAARLCEFCIPCDAGCSNDRWLSPMPDESSLKRECIFRDTQARQVAHCG